jgi:Protein of unknown function (DUF4236)
MPWGYRKRKKLLPGLNVNIGKRSVGLSLGRRGTRISVNTRRQKFLSLGRGGFFWRRKL